MSTKYNSNFLILFFLICLCQGILGLLTITHPILANNTAVDVEAQTSYTANGAFVYRISYISTRPVTCSSPCNYFGMGNGEFDCVISFTRNLAAGHREVCEIKVDNGQDSWYMHFRLAIFPDVPPQIDKTAPYSFSCGELEPVGTECVGLRIATGRGRGMTNLNVVFTGSNLFQAVLLNEFQVAIQTNAVLNHRVLSNIRFPNQRVEITNSAGQSDSVLFQIDILSPPWFSIRYLLMSIYEDTSVGTKIGYPIRASCYNPSVCRGISYSLHFMKGQADFSIDGTGQLRTTRTLDRKRTPLYVLRVLAVDSGISHLTGSTTISLSVVTYITLWNTGLSFILGVALIFFLVCIVLTCVTMVVMLILNRIKRRNTTIASTLSVQPVMQTTGGIEKDPSAFHTIQRGNFVPQPVPTPTQPMPQPQYNL